MKLTKSQLREIIREELQNLTEGAKRGDFVSYVDVYKGDETKWYITYIDSTHVHLSTTKPGTGSTSSFSTYHIRELSDKRWYGDMVKWMQSGNKKHIDGKKYNG